MALLVETSDDSTTMLEPLRQLMHGIDRDVPLYDVQTIERFYRVRATSINGLAVTLIGGLGLMGLTLAVVGLYGLVSYDVGRRTREIGVRIAIGASPGRVLTLVVRDGMAPAWAGLFVGLVLSALTARTVPILVPIGARYDVATVLAVVPIVLLVTLAAAGIPAHRAARVDPTIALRAE
jgi:ABC-type antimicrobial peptide transport system permease subunit